MNDKSTESAQEITHLQASLAEMTKRLSLTETKLRFAASQRICPNCAGGINPETQHCDECINDNNELIADNDKLEAERVSLRAALSEAQQGLDWMLWTRTQCGACGTLYSRCRGCEHAVKAVSASKGACFRAHVEKGHEEGCPVKQLASLTASSVASLTPRKDAPSSESEK